MPLYPIASISIDRPDRQRRALDPEHIRSLADSIDRIGLINPITITADGLLVAGECRLEAYKSLGLSSIPANFTEDLPAETLATIELEENIKRQELPWKDRCAAIAKLHSIHREEDPAWTPEKTGEVIGLTGKHTRNFLHVAKALEENDSLVTKADRLTTAINIIEKKRERAQAAEMASIAPASQAPSPFLNADFIEWQKSYSGPKFNFLHCDFPYGISANKHQKGSGKEFGTYEDSPTTYTALLTALAAGMENLVTESAHLIFWFSLNQYQSTLEALQEMGWQVEEHPLIWSKSCNTGIVPDPRFRPRRVYETAFLAWRGDRPLVQHVANHISAPVPTGIDKIHMSQKSPETLAHFFRLTVDEYTAILDPTCGSGSALTAARRAGASRFCGIETDEGFYREAVRSWNMDTEPNA